MSAVRLAVGSAWPREETVAEPEAMKRQSSGARHTEAKHRGQRERRPPSRVFDEAAAEEKAVPAETGITETSLGLNVNNGTPCPGDSLFPSSSKGLTLIRAPSKIRQAVASECNGGRLGSKMLEGRPQTETSAAHSRETALENESIALLLRRVGRTCSCWLVGGGLGC